MREVNTLMMVLEDSERIRSRVHDKIFFTVDNCGFRFSFHRECWELGFNPPQRLKQLQSETMGMGQALKEMHRI